MAPKRLSIRVVLATLALVPAAARAQTPPSFFAFGAGPWEPEIAVVQSGVVNDVRADVGPDPRYVTLTMNSAQAQWVALGTFAVKYGDGAGFVGNVRFTPRPGNNPLTQIGLTRLNPGR
jgi:hypothetical protein